MASSILEDTIPCERLMVDRPEETDAADRPEEGAQQIAADETALPAIG